MSISRVGQGPWEVVEVMEPDYASYGSKLPEVTVPEFVKSHDPESVCACCGKRLTWRVLVLDKASGNHFVFGRSCALKGDINFTSKEIEAKRRAERMKYKAESAAIVNDFLAEHGEAVKSKPHPFVKPRKGEQALTLADYLTWVRDNKPNKSDTFRAVAIAREKLGLVDPAVEKARAEEAAKKAAQEAAVQTAREALTAKLKEIYAHRDEVTDPVLLNRLYRWQAALPEFQAVPEAERYELIAKAALGEL